MQVRPGTPGEVLAVTEARRIIAETPRGATGEQAWVLAEAREIAGETPGTMRAHLLAHPPSWLREALRPARPEGVTERHRWIPLSEVPSAVGVPNGARGAWFDGSRGQADPHRVIWQH